MLWEGERQPWPTLAAQERAEAALQQVGVFIWLTVPREPSDVMDYVCYGEPHRQHPEVQLCVLPALLANRHECLGPRRPKHTLLLRGLSV